MSIATLHDQLVDTIDILSKPSDNVVKPKSERNTSIDKTLNFENCTKKPFAKCSPSLYLTNSFQSQRKIHSKKMSGILKRT